MQHRMAKFALLICLSILLLIPTVQAANTTVTVTSGNMNGWVLNPDGTVPINFVAGSASTGSGSLQFGPIDGANPANKFIMGAPMGGMLLSDFSSFSYDFIANSLSTSHFYINVYVDSSANGIGSYATWYDCRYDYVPPAGALDVWHTAGFTSSDTGWVYIANPLGSCPSSLGANAAGSQIMILAVNGGQSNASDAGLAGGFDNIIITTSTDSTTYDFEPDLPSPEEAASNLIAYINQLNSDGVINNGQTNALTNKVENALKKLDKGQNAEAIEKLNELVVQANDLALEGVLSPEQLQQITDLTNQVIAAINS